MRSWLTLSALSALFALSAAEPPQAWLELKGLDAWRTPHGDWLITDSVTIDSANPKRLAAQPAMGGIIVNGLKGSTRNLVSKEKFGDIEAHFEFMVPKGSNSGVKFEGLYEIQIYDSHGKKEPGASDCGGIYPRAELTPNYRHIDKGYPPKLNAAKPAGEWQTLDVIFVAPKFDKEGKKTADARFVKVVLNGHVIHENQAVPYPTGHAWHDKEVPTGPILLQADHGPVAFRNIRVRPYSGKTE